MGGLQTVQGCILLLSGLPSRALVYSRAFYSSSASPVMGGHKVKATTWTPPWEPTV